MAEVTATVALTRADVVPSRKRVKLPAWLEVAKPRLIPLLLATTLGGMALTEGWPLSSPRLICTLGGGALASAAAGVLNCLWEQDLDGRMNRTSGRALPSGRLSPTTAFIGAIACTLVAAMLLSIRFERYPHQPSMGPLTPGELSGSDLPAIAPPGERARWRPKRSHQHQPTTPPGSHANPA